MLPVSQDILQWLRGDRELWRRVALGARAQLRWTSHWNTLNMRLSRARLPSPRPAEPPPWLILGCWRSGTTVMHELLAAATGLPTPRTWQCMNACNFALLGAPPRSSAVARPMDGLQIGPLSPQEDEFALLSLGADSAYRAFLMPTRLAALQGTLEASHWLADEGWLARLEDFLALSRLSQPSDGKAMLLKSPNHSFRLQALRRRWPEAKVVWMLRDPAAVFHSNRKMWRQMFEAHRLPGMAMPSDGMLDAFLAQALQQCAHQLRWLAQQPRQHWSVCRQADLLANPRREVMRLLQALAPDQPIDHGQLDQALASTGAGRVEHYAAELPTAVRSAALALQAAQDDILRLQASGA